MKSKKLNRLREAMAAADLPLQKTATNLVFGEGDPSAKLFFIGEAPGKKEDLSGRPFVGSAGKHLDALFDSIGLARGDVYITSLLKYRPPNNRCPTRPEIEAHTIFLIKQVLIVNPQMIVPLGNFATRFVLSGFAIDKMSGVPGISTLHGKAVKMNLDHRQFLVFPLYHPAAVLYNFGLKKTLFRDFKSLNKLLGLSTPKRRKIQ
ncbi:MAG: uracil-DNA glycosylase [Candidatus Omnitrophota bacterium]|nr:uracil-DNA glycosylase [Candidatus Omnitrophota bacterium]